jgi:hypothetical protein
LKRLFLFLFLFLIIGMCTSIFSQEEKDYAFVTLPGGTRIKAEIVDTPEERAQGLMYRDKVEENEGMLFIFEELGFYSFWMNHHAQRTLVPAINLIKERSMSWN